MPNKDIKNRHFDVTEMKNVQKILKKFISIVESKKCFPTTEQKECYANIQGEKKRIINKVMHFRNQEPALCSRNINWSEFYNNYADNLFLTSTILTLQSIIKQLESIQMLDDLSNYNAALEDFEYTAQHKDEDHRLTLKYNVLKLYK